MFLTRDGILCALVAHFHQEIGFFNVPVKYYYIRCITILLGYYLINFAVGYTIDTMSFDWWQEENELPVDIGKNRQLPQFTLIDHSLKDCSQNYTAGLLVT